MPLPFLLSSTTCKFPSFLLPAVLGLHLPHEAAREQLLVMLLLLLLIELLLLLLLLLVMLSQSMGHVAKVNATAAAA